ASLSTFNCWERAGRLTSNSSASRFTGCSPWDKTSRTFRRIGWAMAWKTSALAFRRFMGGIYLSFWLSVKKIFKRKINYLRSVDERRSRRGSALGAEGRFHQAGGESLRAFSRGSINIEGRIEDRIGHGKDRRDHAEVSHRDEGQQTIGHITGVGSDQHITDRHQG